MIELTETQEIGRLEWRHPDKLRRRLRLPLLLQTAAIRIPQGGSTSSHLELKTGGLWGKRVISRLRSPRDDLPFQGHFMIDDKVKIKCTKCSQVFRERAQKVRPNSQTNCAHCNRLITFEFGSDDPNIRRALSSAKEIRVVVEMELKARANADR
jgi:hypothetical protein